MLEILFLWFGVVSLIFAIDLYDRNRANFPIPGIIGLMSIGYYIVSVFMTLP